MITIIITIVALALSLFAAPYIIADSELKISLLKGVLVGANLDAQFYEDENITDYTLQVGLGFILFTLTWES